MSGLSPLDRANAITFLEANNLVPLLKKWLIGEVNFSLLEEEINKIYRAIQVKIALAEFGNTPVDLIKAYVAHPTPQALSPIIEALEVQKNEMVGDLFIQTLYMRDKSGELMQFTLDGKEAPKVDGQYDTKTLHVYYKYSLKGVIAMLQAAEVIANIE